MRFFAHDPGAPGCGLAGESLAHRLLKIELASAIRAAGWHAELEVPGNGWRADVLATSPDGDRRMAWEAQLAVSTAQDLAARTAAMAADGVTVCWVTDKDRPFLGHVPSIRIKPGDVVSEEVTSGNSDRLTSPIVIDGLGAFVPDWCQPRGACSIWAQHGYYGRDEGPCPGHGVWGRPDGLLALSAFVGHVLSGTIRLHEVHADPPRALRRNPPGVLLWTTRPHWSAEQKQIDAGAVADSWKRAQQDRRDAHDRAERDHLRAIAAIEARQAALTPPAVELIGREARGYVGVRDRSSDWAMGVPLFVDGMPRGVVAPVASRIVGQVRDRLAPLAVFVATDAERDRLARVCVPGQRIVVFEVPVQVPEVPRGVERISHTEAINLMFGRPKYPRGWRD